MSENQKTLENLLVDEQEMSEEILHDLLSNYVRIGKQSGDLIPQQPFRDLTAKQKSIIVLLSQRARSQLEMVDSEWISPSEISEQSGIKKGTVYPTVRELENEGLVENEDGNYRVPAHGLDKTREYIRRGEDDE
jgi:DNA-binding MarR family transcriptional regulator